MGKLNLSLTKFIFWPIFAIVAILVSSFSYQKGYMLQGYTDVAFFLIAGFGVLLSVIYWVLEHKNNKVIAHPVYFPVITIVAVIAIITIWLQGNQTFVNPDTNFEVTTQITNMMKVKFTIVNVLFFNMIYMLVFLVSRRTFRLQQIFWFVRLFVLFAIVAIVYSIFKDHEAVATIFSGKEVSIPQIASFFQSENAFAGVIFFGMLALMVLNHYKSRFYNYILLLGFYFYMILTTCTSTFLVGSACLILYIILDVCSLFKKHWVSATILSAFLFVFVAGVIIGVFFLLKNEVSWVVSFFNFIEREILKKDFSTFTGRTAIWKNIWIELIIDNPIHLLFGRGYGTGTIYLRMLYLSFGNGNYQTAISTAHNGFMEIVLSGGIISLFLYGILLLLAFVGIILLLVKKQFRFAFLYLILIPSILLYSFFESTYFFDRSMVNMVMTIFGIMPVFNAVRALYKPKIAKPIKNGNFEFVKMNHQKLKGFVGTVILTLILPCLILFTASGPTSNPAFVRYLFWVLSVLGVAYLFFPQIVSSMYKDSTRRRFIFRMIFYPVLSLCLLVGFMFALLYVPVLQPITNKLWLIFAAYAFIAFVLFVVFSAVKKEKLSSYLRYSLLEPILISKFALPISLLIGVAGNLTIAGIGGETTLTVLSVSVITFITYYLLLTLIPTIRNSYYIHFFNERSLYNSKKVCLKFKI